MKKLISLILALTMLFSLMPSAFAAGRNFSREEKIASELKSLGLFKGVSETNFALGRAPTRVEALVMLIRLLGKETEALNFSGKHPFTDVPSWAEKYVAYGFEKKLTNGISKTKFGSGNPASAEMYLTFVLRALGYTDGAGADFEWDKPYALANSSGLLIGMPDCDNFLRADVVLISYAALDAKLKGRDTTLKTLLFGDSASGDETASSSANTTFTDLAKYITEKDSKTLPLPSVMLSNPPRNEIYAIMYDESEKVLFAIYFLDSETSRHGVTVAFKEGEESLQVIYALTDTATNTTLMQATSSLRKADITTGTKIPLDTIEVFSETNKTKSELSEKISPVMTSGTLMALTYADITIDDALGEAKSIKDLGFTNLKFE